MKKHLLFFFITFCALRVAAQIPTDGLLMPEKTLCTGFMYQHDQWKNYWEGSLKRDNLNIGELTTQNVMWYGVYGLNSKVNLMAMAPYISTGTSMGTMHGMQGVQDLTLAAKYKFLEAKTGPGKLYGFGGAALSTPLTNYAFDYQPLAIGMGSTNISWRLNGNYAMDLGFYLNASTAYTWRSNVTLDRSAYFTNGQSASNNKVWMPNIFDYKVDVGYHKGPLQTELSYGQMVTLGGGDIRRQDMPFVSNRMNASRVSALVMYYVPWPKNFGVRGMVSHTVAGRNVGQTTSLMVGVLYTIHFSKKGDITEETK